MTQHSHQTAPTQFVQANGIRFAYRRFGDAAGVPLVFNQHFTGTMDHWDPAVADGFAKDREVILFNNAGVSSSAGEVPTTFERMGANGVAFIRALGLAKVDVLGFSIGGFVAQEITLQAPDLVRRLVLVGTGPRGGEGMATLTPEAQEIFGAAYDEPDHLWPRVHFTRSEKSQAAGREFLKRFRLRTENRDPEVNEKVAPAQIEAIGKWGAPQEKPFEYLKSIRQPTLVVNGGKDVIIYSRELVHPSAAPAGRPTHPLSRRKSRLAVPVSRALCPACLNVSVGARTLKRFENRKHHVVQRSNNQDDEHA
jgi:pimeloyl-ACP methyl ester carboxylesterase